MGILTSRNILLKKGNNSSASKTYSSKQISDQQRCNTLHIDIHYDVIDKIFNRHLTIIDSSSSTQQIAMNIHKEALNIALRQHLDAAYFKSPNYQRARQMIYVI